MIEFYDIVSNFEKTFRVADIPFDRLDVVIILFEDVGSQIYQRISVHQEWFQECIACVNSTDIIHIQETQNSVEQIVTNSLGQNEIFVKHSGFIKEYIFQIMVLQPIEQEEFRLFATTICQLLAEAVSNNWILSQNFSPDNLCRTAGRLVMQQVMGLDSNSSQSLLILLDRIAFLPYEDRKSYGFIVFPSATTTAVPVVIKLKKLIAFTNVRGIRKLLEIGKDKFCLLAVEEGIYGFGLISNIWQSVVQINFRSDNSWVFTQNGHRLYQVRAGLPTVFRPKLEAQYFLDKAEAAFPHLSTKQAQDLLALLSTAMTQPHGTNILIIDDAQKTALRLESQCTLIEPVLLTNDMLAHISRIDGTVIIEPSGICVGFGAILDGQAARFGDSARGGRYNSAIMFCENSETPCLIVVVSQDGTIDIISSINDLN